MTPFGSVRIEIVPDDDAKANPLIPKDVLAALDRNAVLVANTGHMMYVRESLWAKIEKHVPLWS